MATFHRKRKPPDGKDPRWYKDCLRIDFQCRCAYCLIHEKDYQGHLSFQVDHFKPQSKFLQLERVYSNLYYSCQVCNGPGHKGDSWPEPEEQAMGMRFVDPCLEDWETHIVFHRDGSVVHATAAGRYSIDTLGLARPQLIAHRMENPAEYYARSLLRKMQGQLNRISRIASKAQPKLEMGKTVQQLREALQGIRIQVGKAWNEKKPIYDPPDCPY